LIGEATKADADGAVFRSRGRKTTLPWLSKVAARQFIDRSATSIPATANGKSPDCELNRMKLRIVFLCYFFFVAACGARPAQDYQPSATLKEIMESTIDPNATAVWQAVATTVDESGTHEKFPQTDDEWETLREHTITLMEATNLLLIPGRHIARPGEKAEDPLTDLSPEVVEAMVNRDRESWVRLAHGLHDSVAATLKAVEAKDPPAILDVGGTIDQACENCHQKFRYKGK
jgi:cytochrome c556